MKNARQTRRVRAASVLGLLLAASSSSACANEGAALDTIGIGAEVVDRSTAALTVGAIKTVNGTYGAGCTARSGAWSARVSGTDPLANAALTVIANDAACTITVTELVANAAYALTPAITVTDTYAGSASAVASGSSAFYANAKLTRTGLAADFVVTILYSDDPAAAVVGGVTAAYTAVNGTGSATSVPSPTYTIDFTTSPALDLRVDAADIVLSVSGKARLVDGAVTGTGYVVYQGALSASPTFAEVDAAYAAGTPVAISGSNPQIDGTTLSLVGLDLHTPVVRTILVRRAVSYVPAYQTVKVTFVHP